MYVSFLVYVWTVVLHLANPHVLMFKFVLTDAHTHAYHIVDNLLGLSA